jgi:ATP-binding cassette subfamily B protein
LQSTVALGLGGLLKKRLLYGALRFSPDEIRHRGVGQLLGQVIESEAVESLALVGGFLGLISILELIIAGPILAAGVGGGLHVLALLGWVALTILLAWAYFSRRRCWTAARLDITHDMLERMVGHRTRLAQEAPERWHCGEDQSMAHYVERSQAMDRLQALLLVLVPRGWLVLGLLGLAPALVSSRGSLAGLAISLGGVLFAYHSLTKLSGGLVTLADAGAAWDQVAPLFHSASQKESTPSPTFALVATSADGAGLAAPAGGYCGGRGNLS